MRRLYTTRGSRSFVGIVKHPTASLVALACLTPVVLVACASGADTANPGGFGGSTNTTTATQTTTYTTPTTTTSTPTGTTTTTDVGGTCPDTCASDADCQAACPGVVSGSNCCDTGAGICYVATDPVCPTGTGGGGTGGSTY